MSALAILIDLDEAEYELLLKQDPSTKDNGGYQRLLVTLQEITDETTRQMVLPVRLVERIQRYAFSYGNGGWEDRLTGIFARHLGPRLDQIPTQ